MMIPPDQVHALRSALSGGIVDAHHHLWDLAAGHYPWLQGHYEGDHFFLSPYRALCRDYPVATLRSDTVPLRIAASVHIEAERSGLEQVAETRWVARIHRDFGLPSAIIAHVSFLQPDGMLFSPPMHLSPWSAASASNPSLPRARALCTGATRDDAG